MPPPYRIGGPIPALNPGQVEGRTVSDLPDYSSVQQSFNGFFGSRNQGAECVQKRDLQPRSASKQ